MDWAEASRILGVAETAQDAEIKEQYFYKAQLLHPDKNQDKPENVRKKAEAELALVNQAYAFLSNSENNPYKIPPRISVDPASVHFELNIGERKTATLLVKNVGGPFTNVWIDSHPVPWVTVTSARSISGESLPLEVTLEGVGTGEPERRYTGSLAVKLENEITHAIDNASVELELFTGADPTTTVKRVPLNAVEKPKTRVPPAAPHVQKNPMGFSLAAFLVNFLLMAIAGVGAFYLVKMLTPVSDTYLLAGSIAYGLLAFGLSFNHAINVGSRRRKSTLRP